MIEIPEGKFIKDDDGNMVCYLNDNHLAITDGALSISKPAKAWFDESKELWTNRSKIIELEIQIERLTPAKWIESLKSDLAARLAVLNKDLNTTTLAQIQAYQDCLGLLAKYAKGA